MNSSKSMRWYRGSALHCQLKVEKTLKEASRWYAEKEQIRKTMKETKERAEMVQRKWGEEKGEDGKDLAKLKAENRKRDIMYKMINTLQEFEEKK